MDGVVVQRIEQKGLHHEHFYRQGTALKKSELEESDEIKE